ncbi:hypothetical protein C8Q76DRAFT_803393 [Earliella scabrosa]|nr:hypothetical protein C8Q76DRAFT_803393 [Earliella scabrosa]
MSATEAPIHSWSDIPEVTFSAHASYTCAVSGWTVAHIAVVEVAPEKFGLLICDVLESGCAPSPITAQVGIVLNENVIMYTAPDANIVLLRVNKSASLVTLLPQSTTSRFLKVRFNQRSDYLGCVKAINDAQIATEDQHEEMKAALRRALATAVPRQASETQSQETSPGESAAHVAGVAVTTGEEEGPQVGLPSIE